VNGTVSGAPGAIDRFTAGDTYDNDGNTISSGGVANVYDFENCLIQRARRRLRWRCQQRGAKNRRVAQVPIRIFVGPSIKRVYALDYT
jgi:hypothetical protein